MIELLYQVISVLLVISSFMVVFSYNSIYAVLFLILSYILSAILLLILNCEFLALILITIYVGAVSVLFLFIILMLDVKLYAIKNRLFFYSYSIFLSFIFLIELLFLIFKIFKVNPYYLYIMKDYEIIIDHQNLFSKIDRLLDIEILGQLLSTKFSIQLLIAGLILFLGVVGAVIITLNFSTKTTKQQKFQNQITKNSKSITTVKKMFLNQSLLFYVLLTPLIGALSLFLTTTKLPKIPLNFSIKTIKNGT